MKLFLDPARIYFKRDPMIYGHFLEHFHRQIYGGIYDPNSPFADEDGFRTDVLEALRRIRVPVIRWPGGCFVSSYHWKKGVGRRVPTFDKAWRVEDPNTFGTDEFVKLCRKLDCEPYICANAGTGTEEELSDWVEYCNLKDEGEFAKMRIAGGHPDPYDVKIWSIGNENYGDWEIGAKDSCTWSRLVLESAKMVKRIDPTTRLTAASLVDIDWNIALLKKAADRLDWISIHAYWDAVHQTNALASYDQCMAYTASLGSEITRVRGLLSAMGLENRVKIAFDEWNLRGWYHPNVHTHYQGLTKDEYLTPRNDNDLNASYTMADAVFTACFLNSLLRNADIVGMANFAPVVNTRGAIYTYEKGIVLRTTFYVFDLYVNHMGDEIIDAWCPAPELYAVATKQGVVSVDCVDVIATRHSDTGYLALSAINKHSSAEKSLTIRAADIDSVSMITLSGNSPDDYNDVARDHVKPYENNHMLTRISDCEYAVRLPAHSINIIKISQKTGV